MELKLLKEGEPLTIEREKSEQVFADRKRTNISKVAEQKLIVFLLKRIPVFITSDHLTLIGTLGSLIVFAAFLLAAYSNTFYLLIGIAGLAINWFGDSLDGRLAYYRNTPRKWYGFALDIMMDWLSIVLIGLGYMLYAEGGAKVLAFIFVVLYGWAMIISQIRYKITNSYTIDSGLVGPTEIRIIISMILVCEVLFKGTIMYFSALITVVLFIINIIESRKLLEAGDLRDKDERKP
ncbi:MAG: CDP-alcohol phosphatidyltransferase [Sphingobacteriales bacterium]|nr:CDP-alcohol phosphatidyltransferase [Sphingobacteriales bacterium]